MIFLVDDDPIQNMLNSQIVQKVDSNIDYQIYTNGLDALNSLKEGVQPSVILLDINMPILNGWEFLNEYEQMNYTAQVYILSSSDNHQDLSKSKDYTTIAGYCTKPLTEVLLTDILKTIDY